ncbi:hypothetical protein BZA05DRAFT_411311 [Tricharina praecox]|uniref:uncharacterized protein n=1 Tax=Tricharina praecox TaxID=43433 RepID=UPI0022203FD2|nr:uncharacterized protein BZA05DRAFT_411311 [Tricharina praecox]KAI5843159.1 hypothetical protein BZA05DRAFT_411311 [Tricharina praecox]
MRAHLLAAGRTRGGRLCLLVPTRVSSVRARPTAELFHPSSTGLGMFSFFLHQRVWRGRENSTAGLDFERTVGMLGEPRSCIAQQLPHPRHVHAMLRGSSRYA